MGGYLGQGVSDIITPDKVQGGTVTVTSDSTLSSKLNADLIYVDFSSSLNITITLPKVSNKLRFSDITLEIINAPSANVNTKRLTIAMDPSDTFVGSNGETSTKVLDSKIVATGQRITLTHDSDKYWKRILLSENDPLGVSQKATVVPYGVTLSEYFLNASSGFYRIDSGTNYTNDMGFDPGIWYDILVTSHEISKYKIILAINSDGNVMNGAFIAGSWTGFKGTNIPPGVPIPYPGSTAPPGYLLVNGGSFDKTKYPQLGLLYPSGVLPDLRGQFIRGWDNGRGIDPSRSILSDQSATQLRPALWDHFGKDGSVDTNAIGIGFSDPDTLTTGQPVNARSSGNVIPEAGNSDTGITGNILTSGVGSTGYWISTRPRNVAYNYIVRAQ